MSLLLDTCVLSELVYPRSDANLLAWYKLQNQASLFVSVLTLGEIEKGQALLPPSRRRHTLESWLGALRTTFAERTLPIDDTVAAIWGRLAAASNLRGRQLSVIDGLIAATATRHGFSVVTRNVSDFSMTSVPLVNPWQQHQT